MCIKVGSALCKRLIRETLAEVTDIGIAMLKEFLGRCILFRVKLMMEADSCEGSED